MSLVNDALRRATEAQKKINSEPPKLPLRPAAPPMEEAKGLGLAWPLSLVLFVAVVGLIGWLNRGGDSLPVQARTPAAEIPRTFPTSASVPAATNSPTNQPALAAGPSAPPKPEPLRLQAVFFNPRNPSAIIGGKTVVVGDSIRHFRVAAIASNSALLISATETNLLTLE